MKRSTSALLAVALAAGGGLLVFQSLNATSGTFNGTISSGGSSGSSFSGSAVTFASTQTDGGAAFVAPTGSKVCLDGATCSQYVTSDGGTIGLVGAEVDAPNGFTDSQKVNPETIIAPLGVVAQAPSGQAAFKVAQTGARIYFDVGGNIYAYSDGSQVVAASAWVIQSLSTDTIGQATAGRNRTEIFYPQPYPLGSLLACDSTHKGVIQTLSGTGRTYACDGTTNQQLAYDLVSATTTLDFPSLAAHTSATLTVSVTGATTADVPLCRTVGGTGLTPDIDIHEYVSATDTVSLVAHNDGTGTVDPPATDVKCVILR